MKKRIFILASLLLMSTSTSVYAATSQVPTQISTEQEVISQSITPYADVIVHKYREYYGKLQVRRWNETRGYWVDSTWTTISIH